MKVSKETRKEAMQEIKEIDEGLSLLREGWLSAKESNKLKHLKLINKMLDERLICMAKRDGKNSNATN